MKVKTYSRDEALRAPRIKNGLYLKGWLWKRPSSKAVIWIYTSSINNASRTYPGGTEFVPVYVEEE